MPVTGDDGGGGGGGVGRGNVGRSNRLNLYNWSPDLMLKESIQTK